MIKNPNFNSENKNETIITDNESMSHLDMIPFHITDDMKNFAFVSYSHKDFEDVYTDIGKFHVEGFNIWYDEGIRTGNIWKDVIKEKIRKSKFFILFLSENAINSPWIKKEINFAKKYHIPMVPIYIEEFEFPNDMKWLDEIQSILKYEYNSDNIYYNKCIHEFKEKLKELKPPFPSYEGDDEYIFVDYDPKDFKIICPEIVKFHEKGFNIWYKAGITNREKRNHTIIERLNKACLEVIFITTNSIESDTILKRMFMKPSEKILLIYLDDIDESDEMYKQLEYRLSKIQAIFKNEFSDEEYEKKYIKVFEEHNCNRNKTFD